MIKDIDVYRVNRQLSPWNRKFR